MKQLRTSLQDRSVLVVNAGSSSLKLQLFPQDVSLLVERIGDAEGAKASVPLAREVHDHAEALRACLAYLAEQGLADDIAVVGHRVVHGGEYYQQAVRIDAKVLERLESLIPLAPLHNPANLAGIRAAREVLTEVPQVAVFDTAFHSSLEPEAFLYGLPYACYQRQGIRRYGFHGMSHDYVSRRAAELLGQSRDELKIISLHLGNGASAAAIAQGKVVDHSMGMTPLEGLVMGTRVGDVDPGILLYLLQTMTSEQLDTMLNTQSGLKGLSGVSNDMRDIHAAIAEGNTQAETAFAVFIHRIKRYIGAFCAVMNGLDVLIFTAGIGEHDALTRQRICEGLDSLGIILDEECNAAGETELQHAKSQVKILRIPTNEALLIAEQSVLCLESNA